MRTLIGFTFAATLTASAHAQTYQGVIEGTIDGDNVRIEYELDASTPDTQPGDPDTGVYPIWQNAVLEIAGNELSVDGGSLNVFSNINIVSVQLLSNDLCNDPQEGSVAVILSSGPSIATDAIPDPFTDADFSSSSMFLNEAGTCNQVNGTLSSWVHSIVPEPDVPATSTWGLLVLSLLLALAATTLHRLLEYDAQQLLLGLRQVQGVDLVGERTCILLRETRHVILR